MGNCLLCLNTKRVKTFEKLFSYHVRLTSANQIKDTAASHYRILTDAKWELCRLREEMGQWCDLNDHGSHTKDALFNIDMNKRIHDCIFQVYNISCKFPVHMEVLLSERSVHEIYMF